ncbi:response regulator [Candidatus Electronema sp. JM]|uniref:response regulator n=1 Tax=Candidatus Electronema sp. JM TaxID=3401571 RepID=UPI003AA7EA60
MQSDSAEQLARSITAAADKDNLPAQSALKQVLIIDDDPALLLSIRAGLEDNPRFQVLTASSGREALDILDQRNMDLAVLDIIMPDMDGIQLLTALSESFSEIPSIVMTGFDSPVMKRELKQAGALAVLDKPLDIDTLEQEIISALTDSGRRRCDLPLEIFLQLAAMERRTVHLKVFQATGSGSFFFREGLLVDAELDGLSGDNAVLAMLDWSDFTLGLKEYVPPYSEPRVNSALAYLLLKTSCRLDQYGSSACLERARTELRRLQAARG